MPWHLENDNPDCSGWAVVKDSDGEIEGCHETKADAQKQMAALYANERSLTEAGTSPAMGEDMHSAPREDLVRMVPMARAEASDDGNTLVGYAAVFDDWTEIDSWEGTFNERISPKAFNKTIRENGDRIKVLFNHGFDPQIGDKPLGKPRVIEPRSKGLWTETPLDETSYNADLKALLRSGALDGMSFRFSVVADEWEDRDGQEWRTISEVKLHEFGPVTFPAYEATTAGVRNAGAYQLWRSMREHPAAMTTTTNTTNYHLYEADAPTEEDRSTEEDAASTEEDRDTSAIEKWKAVVLLAREDIERQRDEVR